MTPSIVNCGEREGGREGGRDESCVVQHVRTTPIFLEGQVDFLAGFFGWLCRKWLRERDKMPLAPDSLKGGRKASGDVY